MFPRNYKSKEDLVKHFKRHQIKKSFKTRIKNPVTRMTACSIYYGWYFRMHQFGKFNLVGCKVTSPLREIFGKYYCVIRACEWPVCVKHTGIWGCGKRCELPKVTIAMSCNQASATEETRRPKNRGGTIQFKKKLIFNLLITISFIHLIFYSSFLYTYFPLFIIFPFSLSYRSSFLPFLLFFVLFKFLLLK